MVSHVSKPKRLGRLLMQVALLIGLTASFPATADVRILLDISRSMAENDPGRTRVEALEMLIDSLPNGERAGIWTFGQYVNLLMPHEPVSAQWRAEAKALIAQQTSPAVRTNMGRALEEAAYDFNFSTYAGEADAVLITDGNVDIAPNTEVNQVERGRILSQVVDRFAAANAKIHTIALSDQADVSLLRQLSEQTGGQFQQIQRGENMTLSMLDLVAEVSPSSELPLQQNAFDVDPEVSELVVLVNHESGAVSLTSPTGQVTSALSPRNQRWRVGDGFTQVTIGSPAAGRWQLDGALEQSGNVRVFSDISLQWVAPSSASVAKDSTVFLEAELVGPNGESIAQDLAPIIQASIRVDGMALQTRVQGERIVASLQPRPQAESVNIELIVEGGTFSRLLNRQIRFVDPYLSEVLMTDQGYEWRLYPNRLLGEVDAINAQANYSMNGAQRDNFVLQDEGYWMWLLPYDGPNGEYEVTLSGNVQQGLNTVALNSETITLRLPATPGGGMAMTPSLMSDVDNQPPASSADFVKDPMPEFEELQADIVVSQNDLTNGGEWDEDPVGTGEGLSWMSYLLLSIPGVLILVIAYVVYRRFEKKTKPLSDDEDTILGGDEFSGLDDPHVLMQDNDLDISQLDDDGDDIVPVMNERVSDGLREKTEAPSIADEDMLDIEPTIEAEPLLDETSPEDVVADTEEELFDISSIDDDLSDLDLALDGDDPFALDDEPKK